MVTPRDWQMRPLIVACMAAVIVAGLGAAAVSADTPGDEQRPINIDVRDMAIGDVLRMLGQAADVNIIVGQGVVGDIQSLTLRNVSVEAALRLITEAQGYHWRLDENVYVVSADPAPGAEPAPGPAMSDPEGQEGQPVGSQQGGSVPPPPPVPPIHDAPPAPVPLSLIHISEPTRPY